MALASWTNIYNSAQYVEVVETCPDEVGAKRGAIREDRSGSAPGPRER